MMNIKKRFTKWYVNRGYKFCYDSSSVAVWHCPWWVKPLLIFFSPSVYFMSYGNMFMDGFLDGLKNGMEAKEKINVFDMTKEDFKKVPERGGWSRDIGEFSALVIIPQDYAHDSGWMCMDFVAVSKDGEPICRLSGYSDVLNLDGIGGYGNWRLGELPNRIEPKGWCIDCLPCGYLRLFSRRTLTAGAALRSFEIYAK